MLIATKSDVAEGIEEERAEKGAEEAKYHEREAAVWLVLAVHETVVHVFMKQ